MKNLKKTKTFYRVNSRIIAFFLLCVLFIPSYLHAQKEKPAFRYYYSKQEKQNNAADKNYKLLPSSVFLLFQAGIQGEYVPKQFFSYRNPSFGLKVGTMKNTGWFFGFMTNFNFKGAFNTFAPNETIANTKKSNFYCDATIGITGRYFRPATFLFGVGAFYHTLNTQNSTNKWGHFMENKQYGPMVSAGFMFHIQKIALSLEVTSNYNVANMDESTGFQAQRIGLGAKLGIGFCLARNAKQAYSLNSPYRDDLDGYGKDLRKQEPVSFKPSTINLKK